MGLAVGLAFTPSQAFAQQFGTPTENIAVSGQPVAVPSGSQVHVVLRSGADCYRKGDYELAATYLQQAKVGEANLGADEKRDLANWLSRNNTALDARRDGANQLKMAEEAARKGQMQDAAAWLKAAMSHAQFLTVADRLRMQQLADQVTPGAPKVGASGTVDSVAAANARTKLKLARQLMAKGNYDAAEAMAREADQMRMAYSVGEDTPARVLNDIVNARLKDGSLNNDPKALLVAARAAMGRGEFDLAEKLAHQADKNTSFFGSMTSSFHGDTPTKVLKEIQAARAYANSNKSAQPTQTAAAVTPTRPQTAPVDPRLLVRQGRDLYNQNKLDEAEKLAYRANSNARSVSWGYFEDTPDKLITDINKAKTKQNQEESVRVLAEARRQFAGGNLVEAEKLANRAERLHGPYGLMEMGDRPQKLLAEIEATRARNHIPRVPAAQMAAKDAPSSTNQQTTMPAPTTYGGQSAMPKAPVPTGQQVAGQSTSPYSSQNAPSQSMPAASSTPYTGTASNLPAMPAAASTPYSGMASSSQGMSTAPSTPYSGMPSSSQSMPAASSTPYGGMAATGTANRQTPVVPSWPGQTDVKVNVNLSAPAVSLAADEAKMKAQTCLADARRLMKEGRLLEARQKALEAQRMNVVFRAEDDKPEIVLMAVNSLCQRKVDALMQQADQCIKAGQSDVRSMQLAEQQLSQAKQLALGFNMDCYLIDMKAAQVKQATGQSSVAATIPPQFGTVPAAPVQNHDQGHELLAKARMELRAGQTANARRLANEAFSPNLGVQNEAAHLLQEIDTEEFNQKVLVAKRTFDAAVSAYNRQEYAQAKAMFRTIDAHLLPPDRQARLNEYMRNDAPPPVVAQTSRWQDGQQSATMPTLPSIPQAVVPSFSGTAHAMSSMQSSRPAMSYDQPPSADLIAQTKAMQEVKFQKLRNEGMAVMAESRKRFDNGETVKAIDMLKEHIRQVEASGFDSDKIVLLKKQPEARLQTFMMLQKNKDFETAQNSDHKAFMDKKAHEFLAEEAKKKQIAELMNQYHSLYKEHKYREAEICAIKAKELDPDNYVLGAAVQEAHMAMARQEYHELEVKKEEMVRKGLNQAEDPGPSVNLDNPVAIDQRINGISKFRTKSDTISLNGARSEKEREILRKLDGQATAFEFRDTPLQQVLDDLANWSQINIVQDVPALKDANISTTQPITMKLEGASLKSALNLLLHQAHLTYQVANDALVITTEENAHGKLERRVFPVLDLVIPVLNYTSGGAAAALQQAIGTSGQPDNSSLKINGQTTPWVGMNSLSTGTPVSNGTITGGVQNANSMTSVPASQMQGPKDTIEDVLIKLIQNTIEPQSWSTVGGPGTIEFYPLGKALVVNQTPDIQEQVQELLNALRRLQDQEVAVEVKFITIAEAFYERIGLDFNINITNNNSKYSQQINSQQFAPFGFLNNFNPKNLVSGLTPAGNLTQDLGIPINTSSFQMAVPPFGQYPNIPGGNGGIDLGIAFLSDIQVFMFMEAAQGDQRTNVMQAPKLTLFNGQTSTITITDLQFFVTSVSVVQIGGQVVFVPTNTPVPTGGVTMTIQAVISADRRYVRMSLTPNLTNLASANITLFPITTFITPVFEGGAVGQPVPFTQFLQQPTFNSISVNTTVNVPDGGTVLLGGLKRLSEGRNEFGPPILSSIPYIDRLFKNVGYGRETTSLLMMVTPRIIINEEEESRQVPGALQSANTQQP
jgi:type II secretory pathway component GspD/PulD (secretin)/tetratricopeptide (TPR) repeat protein